MTMAERLFSMLDEHSDGQAGLARFLGINQSNITTWKKRNTDPPAKYIIRICEFLGVSPEYLLSGENAQKSPASAELSEDEAKVLKYYNRLPEDDRDYIKGEMVRLYKADSEADKENEHRAAR